MIHKMKLWNDAFEKIQNNTKTIEMRLNDEKRSLIKIGDMIEFTNTATNEAITRSVKNLFQYNSFEKLYANHDKRLIGYEADEKENPSDMLKYYSKEDINIFGVLAIELNTPVDKKRT